VILRAVIAAAALAALLAGVQTWRLHGEQTQHAETRAAWAAERADTATRTAAAEAQARAIEMQRATALETIRHEAQTSIAQARTDAAAAARAAGSLRQRAAALAATCDRGPAPNPAPAGGSAPTAGAGLLLADVLQRADDVAGELAAAYDQARAAGLACERSYDSLTLETAP
jgi:NADH dehydrogenase/NADH:ubiquinone oxidoreductase subunit G